MNILFISDFGLHQNLGGAQRSNATIIKEGRERGHTIVEVFHDSNPLLLNYGYDVVISSNLEFFCQKYSNIIEFLGSCEHHVRLEHDANRYLSEEDRKKLWESCRISFFLTELHRDRFLSEYDYISFKNIEIVPDPISSNNFYNKNKERSNKILYSGFMHPLKGINNFLLEAKLNPDSEFVIAGWSDSTERDEIIEKAPNISLLGKVHFSEMNSLYNSFTKLFCFPNQYEPFCRAAGEAIMCGMEILSDGEIGSVEDFKKVGLAEFTKGCDKASIKFWEKIESEFSGRTHLTDWENVKL